MYEKIETPISYSYEELHDAVKKYIPEKYLSGSTIKTEYIVGDFNSWELNIADPYKPMLPSYFSAHSKDNPYTLYKINKGCYDTLRILEAIPRYNDYELISDLMIAAIFNDYETQHKPVGRYTQYRRFIPSPLCNELILFKNQAKEKLKENEYGIWHSSAKYYLPFHNTVDMKLLDDATIADKDALGKYIAETFEQFFEGFEFTYRRYDDVQYKRAEAIRERAYEQYGEMLGFIIKYKNES